MIKKIISSALLLANLTIFSQNICLDKPNGLTFNQPNEKIFSFSKWPEFTLPSRFKIIFDKPGEMPQPYTSMPNPAHTNRNALKHGFSMMNGNVGVANFVADSLSVSGAAVNFASISYGGFGATPCMSNFEATGDPWGFNISDIASQAPNYYDLRCEYFVLDWEPWTVTSIYSSDNQIWTSFHNSSNLPSYLVGTTQGQEGYFASEYRLRVRAIIGEFFNAIKNAMRPNTYRSLWSYSNGGYVGYWVDSNQPNWNAVVSNISGNTMYFNSDPDPQNNWAIGINTACPAPYYFKNPESTNNWQGTEADAYVTYQLMQVEAHRTIYGNAPIIPCLWNKFESFDGFYKEPITKYMAEAQVIFPLMAGADGLWFWGEGYTDFSDCNDPQMPGPTATYCNTLDPKYRNGTGYTDASLNTENGPSHPVQTEDPYEHMVNALWRLSQFNHIFTDNGGNVEFVKPSDAFSTYRLPVWRGVRNGNKILIAAHNPSAPVGNPNFITSIPVSYVGNGYNWSTTITLTGREVFLCEFDLNTNCTSIPAAPAVSSNVSTACAIDLVTLSAVGCSNGTTFWSNGQSGNTTTVNGPGTYSAYCSENGCNSVVSSIVINSCDTASFTCNTVLAWNTLPDAVVTCNGLTTFILRATGGNAEFSTDNFNWYPSNFPGGAYTFTVTPTTSCVSFWARPAGCSLANGVIWGCYTGQVTSVCTTGLSESVSALTNIKLYPNPAQSAINIGNIAISDIEKLIVTDVVGRIIILSNPTLQLNIADLDSGNYFLTVQKKGGAKSVLKFVKY